MPNSIRTQRVNIGGVEIGEDRRFALIAGPCVIESKEHSLFMAEKLQEITTELGIPFIFKASFDKANRTAVDGFRGPGLDKGLSTLSEIRSRLNTPVTTDIHRSDQADDLSHVIDMIQIPAFLCRQTDLILSAALTGKAVNIKKGQFLAPWDIENAANKARSTGNSNVIVTERGTTFGYNNLVVDITGFPIMREKGTPLVFDVTHSLQLPGGLGRSSGGRARFIQDLAQAGVAAGIDALFMEVHDQPEKALSDGPNSCPLDELPTILSRLVRIEEVVKGVL